LNEDYDAAIRQITSSPSNWTESFTDGLVVARNQLRRSGLTNAPRTVAVTIQFATGERLSNEAFSASGSSTGRIIPKAKIVEGSFEYGGKDYATTELWVGFFVPRREETVRTRQENEFDEDDLIVASLKGMHV